ncbi:hypothetical protein Y032_0541g3174 [Ancylostoma ceylanicum]|uniref:Uncharacterized protein n=1 Tax=Ancylostoma ceylanicum TaxID=53326 RepID=A0A016WR49_9BILA|nr:hypothetical protein Y032_0541g3174 [Ancylostoma ceylanicum]
MMKWRETLQKAGNKSSFSCVFKARTSVPLRGYVRVPPRNPVDSTRSIHSITSCELGYAPHALTCVR